MTTDASTHRCPRCGAAIPAEAPQGLCPACLLAGVALGTETVATFTTPGQPAARGVPTLAEVAAAFPQLEILECIGQGGMGVVFKARQPKLQRLVALKLLPQFAAADAGFRERFTREARLLARLNHPNIVTVFDFGDAGGFFYLLMEYVDGANLRQAMRAGRFTPGQALEIVPKICDALQYAHSEGVLHRDIKPENILLDLKGRVKIADFGIAKLAGQREPGETLTASGAAVGTPQYMAPEQLERPREVDHRADIYSLGVVFYEMLTGELPLGRFAPPSAKTPVDERVDAVVFRTLEKEREKRFQSAGEVKTEVEGLTAPSAGSRVETPRPGAAPGAGTSRTFAGTGAGGAGASPAPASVRLKPEHRPWAMIGLIVALAVLVPRCLPLPGVLISLVGTAWRGHGWSAVVPLLAVAGGVWLLVMTWRHRARLLEPFMAAEEAEPAAGSGPGSRWLEWLAVAVLMLLVLDLAAMVVAAVAAFMSGFPGLLILAAIAVIVLLVRRQGRQLSPCPAETGPAWQTRAGVLFLVLAALGCWPWFTPVAQGVRDFTWPVMPLVGATGLALLLRSRLWRTIALAVNVVIATGLVLQWVALFIFLTRHAMPGLPEGMMSWGGLPLASVLALAQALPFVGGLVVLRRAEVMRSFGLSREVAAPGTGATLPSGTGKVSGKAIAALLLVGFSAGLILVLVALAAFAARRGPGFGLGPLEMVLGLVVLGMGVVGTVLGMVAWIEIRRSGGGLRGKPLAVLATFTWPALLFVMVPLLVLPVFWFSSGGPARPLPMLMTDSATAKGTPLAGLDFQLPAGQVAVFELVTLVDDRPEPLAGYALHAVAGDADIEGRVRLEGYSMATPEGEPAGWRFSVSATGSRAVMIASTAPMGWEGLRATATLQERIGRGTESVHWLVRDPQSNRNLGLRIRAFAHEQAAGTIGTTWLGAGTNWTDHLSVNH